MCPSGRLFDNSSKLHAVGRKCLHVELSHQCLDRVRRWERSVKKWLSYRKNYHNWPDHGWEEVQGFFQKNFLWLFTAYISLLSFMRSTHTSATPVPWRSPWALICCTMGCPHFEAHIALGFKSEVSAFISYFFDRTGGQFRWGAARPSFAPQWRMFFLTESPVLDKSEFSIPTSEEPDFNTIAKYFKHGKSWSW